MVGYYGQVFLCVFVNLDEVEANKNVRTRRDIQPYWPNKLGQERIYFMVKTKSGQSGKS